jgi:hypothetical protein
MLSADKIREITKRSRHNIYDEQLRILNEEILESAKRGNYSFTIWSENCEKQGFDYDFWFSGARTDSTEWQKVNLVMSELGYTVSYEVRKFDDIIISFYW